MTLNDTLSNALSKIYNAEKAGKETCIICSSKVIREVLALLNKHHYIGQFKEIKGRGSNVLEISLLKSINKCGAIKPRFPVTKTEIEKYEKRFLPAKDFGFLIVSTNKGLLTHTEARLKNIGGKLIAYCY
jgi:small subunit ribosomal protein S8